MAKVYENLANCYFDKQSLDAAEFYIKKAIATTLDSNTALTNQARLQLLAAKIKWQQQETQAAVQLFNQLLRTAAPNNFFLKAQCLFYLAQIAVEQQDGATAKSLIARALTFLQDSSEGNIASNNVNMIAALLLLNAEALAQTANQSTSQIAWTTAWQAYLEAEQYIQQQQANLVQLSSTLYWNDHYDRLYDGMVTTAFELAAFDKKYDEIGLQYSERSKAAYLKNLLQRKPSKSNLSNTHPASLQEQQLIQRLLWIENSLFQETNKGILADIEKVKILQQQQYTFQQQLKHIQAELQAIYPTILPTNPKLPSLKSWQKKETFLFRLQ